MSTSRFEHPDCVLVDQPGPLRLVGVTPGTLVRITARCQDRTGTEFSSWATYRAGETGTVDPTHQRAFEGSYSGLDPFGLWWSMRVEGPQGASRAFARGSEPLTVRVEAAVEGVPVAAATVRRLRLAPGVGRVAIRRDGVVGTLFMPPRAEGPGAGPVVVLGGSEGGVGAAEELAGLLASHGLACLALAYCGAEAVPAHLAGIPLEYVESAAALLASHDEVAPGPVALLGLSRGAELALLCASRCHRIGAVVGYAPSSVVWPGVVPLHGELAPAWTHGGIGVPFAVPEVDGRRWAAPATRSAPAPVRPVGPYLAALARGRGIAAATIPVEQARGPFLFVSGGDDQMWPSRAFAELALARLACAGRPSLGRHLHYPGAGHSIGRPPGLPAAIAARPHPSTGLTYAQGGTPQANAKAAADSWPQVIRFLAGTGPEAPARTAPGG